MRFFLATLLTLSLFISSTVYAAETFTLTQIGALETKGVKYNQWWYEPQQVKLKGTGSKESNIPLVIDGRTETIKVGNDGMWTYDLGLLTVADHSIVMGTSGDQYSFVLTIGSAPPADMKGSTKGGLPAAGQVLPFIGLLGLAGLLIFYSFKKESV